MPGGYPGPLRDGFKTEAVFIIISIISIIMITVYYHNVVYLRTLTTPNGSSLTERTMTCYRVGEIEA